MGLAGTCPVEETSGHRRASNDTPIIETKHFLMKNFYSTGGKKEEIGPKRRKVRREVVLNGVERLLPWCSPASGGGTLKERE